MIATWEEINSRYEEIKDHKPRAVKKLKEIGEILASAYRLDPQRADEMWQYIIELNIKDNIAFSKFYIAQVFNKLTDSLRPEEAAEFVSMRPERVRLMFIYGYDGGTLNHVAYTIIGSQVLDGRCVEAVEIISMIEEKFTTQEDLNIYSLYSVINTLCMWLETKQEQEVHAFRYDIPLENILAFYEDCCREFEDEYIQAILRARIYFLIREPIYDRSRIMSILNYLSEAAAHNNYALSELFTDFLYSERDIVGDEAENIVLYYCREAERILLPIFSANEDGILLEKPNWYREIITCSQQILREMFEKESCKDFLKSVLQNYMYESDWKPFLQFLVLGLNQETEHGSSSYLKFIKDEIRDYLSVIGKKIEYKDGTWWTIDEPKNLPSSKEVETSIGLITIDLSYSSRRSISQPRVTEENVNDFIAVLARACILTSGSPVNGQLIDEVRAFVTKETGSVDALNQMGMEVEVDNRTELEKLCDYAEKESLLRAPYDNFSNQRQREYEFVQNIQRETGTYGIETGKLLAKQPQILSFLFLHDAHSFSIKKDIILGAILDDNYPSALKCVDYMIETATYPNFSDRNSWSMEMKNTLSNILRDVFRNNTSMYSKPYPESVTLTVIQITEKCLPYLGGDDATEVKANLVKLKPSDDAKDEFIHLLLRDVDDYTSEKKPRGYSKRINNITNGIMQGIETLSKLNRMDIVAQILRRITEGRNYIAGPNYESWMTNFTRVTDEQRLELYSLIPDVYAAYIEASDPKMALSLLQIFGKTGDLSVYRTLKKQILQKHGYIDGMSSCFHYSVATNTPIVLCKNNFFEISFLYWNVNNFYIQSGIHSVEVAFQVTNRYKDYVGLCASNVTINGMPLSELKKKDVKDNSNREQISYYLGSGDIETESLYLYWDYQRKPPIKEISEISFSIIAQSDNKDIAETGTFTIVHNSKDDIFVLKE